MVSAMLQTLVKHGQKQSEGQTHQPNMKNEKGHAADINMLQRSGHRCGRRRSFSVTIVQSLVRSPKRTHCVKLRQFPTVGRKAIHLLL